VCLRYFIDTEFARTHQTEFEFQFQFESESEEKDLEDKLGSTLDIPQEVSVSWAKLARGV